MSPLSLPLLRLPPAAEPNPLPLPSRATGQSAGLDLRAALRDPLTIEAGARALVPTGFAMQLPAQHEAQVRPRSGLALRHGLTVLNAPGTIDADYRGEIKVLLINLGHEAVTLERGQRIAQLIVAPVSPATPIEVHALDDSARGTGGFGHTGR